jgi:hypothetical protein
MSKRDVMKINPRKPSIRKKYKQNKPNFSQQYTIQTSKFKTFNNKYTICQMKLMKWKGLDKIKRKKAKALIQ